MRYFNQEFDYKLAQPRKEPRYVYKIIFDTDHFLYLTSHKDIVITAPNVISGCSLNKSASSQELDPNHLFSTIGAMKFAAVDLGGAVSDFLEAEIEAGRGVQGKFVELYLGYKGLSFDDGEYQLFPPQVIFGDELDHRTYHFSCNDVQRMTKKQVFIPKKTHLRTALLPDDTDVNVDDSSGFSAFHHGDTFSDAPNQKVGYLKIKYNNQFEIIRWSVGNNQPTQFVNVERGVFNTPKLTIEEPSNSNRVEVTEYIYLEMPAMEIAYGMLSGYLYSEPGEEFPWNLGIDSQYLALSDFFDIGNDIWDPTNNTGIMLKFKGLGKQDGKAFLEKQVYPRCGVHSLINLNGQLGLSRFRDVAPDSTPHVYFSTKNVKHHSALKRDRSTHRVGYLIQYDWNEELNSYSKAYVLNDVKAAAHGVSKIQEMSQRGITHSHHSDDSIHDMVELMRSMYTAPGAKLAVTTFFKELAAEVGDIAHVKLPIRDYFLKGTLDRAMRIHGQTVNFDQGDIRFKLFANSERYEPLPPVLNSGTLPDSFYTSVGQDLYVLFPAQISKVGNIYTLHTDITVNGDVDPKLASSIFFIQGDFVIAPNVTMKIVKSVQLRVMGFLTIDGNVDGKGGGLAEGEVNTHPQGWYTGLTGHSSCYGGASFTLTKDYVNDLGAWVYAGDDQDAKHEYASLLSGYRNIPEVKFELENGEFNALPFALSGARGGRGREAVLFDLPVGPDPLIVEAPATVAGGAGFCTISRGVSTTGQVDLSGEDGVAPTQTVKDVHGHPLGNFFPGSSGPGYPGVWYIFLDGPAASPPTLTPTRFKAEIGNMPFATGALPLDVRFGGHMDYNASFDVDPANDYQIIHQYAVGLSEPLPDTNKNRWESMHQIQYLLPPQDIEEEVRTTGKPLAIVVTETVDQSEDYFGRVANLQLNITPPTDTRYAYSRVFYRIKGVETEFNELRKAAPASVLKVAADGTEYEFMALSVSKFGIENPDPTFVDFTTSNVPSPTTKFVIVGFNVDTSEAQVIKGADGALVAGAKLSWNLVTDTYVVALEIQYKKSASANWIKWADADVGDTESEIRPLETGVDYDFRIRASKGGLPAHKGDWETRLNETIEGITTPPPPVDDNLTAKVRFDGVVELSWTYSNKPLDHLGFRIFIKNQGEIQNPTLAQMNPVHDGEVLEIPYRITNLPFGKYTAAVVSVDTSGNLSTDRSTVFEIKTEVEADSIHFHDAVADGFSSGTIQLGGTVNGDGELEGSGTTVAYTLPVLGLLEYTRFKPRVNVIAEGEVTYHLSIEEEGVGMVTVGTDLTELPEAIYTKTVNLNVHVNNSANSPDVAKIKELSVDYAIQTGREYLRSFNTAALTPGTFGEVTIQPTKNFKPILSAIPSFTGAASGYDYRIMDLNTPSGGVSILFFDRDNSNSPVYPVIHLRLTGVL